VEKKKSMFNRSISDMNEVDRDMSFDILRLSSLLKNGMLCRLNIKPDDRFPAYM
jgi:hypothetical protein